MNDAVDHGFEDFVRARSEALMRYGYVLTGNPHDAADLTQEALARLGSAWSRVRRRDDPEGYVRTTMARLQISWWRRRRHERLVDEIPEREHLDPGFARADGDGGLWRALAGLPRRQRTVLVLRYYEHRDDEEIARLLGISRGTVRSQAARGLDKLRAAWLPGPAVAEGGAVTSSGDTAVASAGAGEPTPETTGRKR
ncbi:SigE family RNA polymerase sigma factor [Plantactinospora sp. S1510]|uniref:SigE family RNA polymerase sigma factor n=1 Tax=Plantactinospora alkalitolerans TaxID=2789879 RepID=A0ABS0GXG5_9ACTN|nr:SigE family RNA polymerase sigma factor [Plantactinospora alkalitolerans]MBF9130896.1 SigE family RNA polymerase sigma factor [Plantactinospora alkalitolerans]